MTDQTQPPAAVAAEPHATEETQMTEPAVLVPRANAIRPVAQYSRLSTPNHWST